MFALWLLILSSHLRPSNAFATQLSDDWDIDNLDSVYQTGVDFGITYNANTAYTDGYLVIRLFDGVNSIYECQTEGISSGDDQALSCSDSNWMQYCSEYGNGVAQMEVQLYGTKSSTSTSLKIDITQIFYDGTSILSGSTTYTLGTSTSPHDTYLFATFNDEFTGFDWVYLLPYYVVYDWLQSESWAAAELHCEYKYGTTLATLGSTDKAQNAIHSTTSFTSYGLWIGLRDRYEENNWEWIDDTTCSYTGGDCSNDDNWAPNEPNNSGEEDCALIAPGSSRIWNDVKCTDYTYAETNNLCNVPPRLHADNWWINRATELKSSRYINYENEVDDTDIATLPSRRSSKLTNIVTQIKFLTYSGANFLSDATSATLKISLCWDNVLTSCTVTVDTTAVHGDIFVGNWLTVPCGTANRQLSCHGTCNSDNTMSFEIIDGWDFLDIYHIKIKVASGIWYGIVKYCLEEDDVYGGNLGECVPFPDTYKQWFFRLDSNSPNYPSKSSIRTVSDPLSGVNNNGPYSNALLIQDEVFEAYVVSITLCDYYQTDADVTLGIIVKGSVGNSRQQQISVPSGSHDTISFYLGQYLMGNVLSVYIEMETESTGEDQIDICVQEFVIKSPSNTARFDSDYFGKGLFFTSSCGGNAFQLLSYDGIYRQCVDEPLFLDTFVSSTSAIVSMHTCVSADAGINFTGGSLTIKLTGKDEFDAFISADPISLSTTEDWSADEERSYSISMRNAAVDSIAIVTLAAGSDAVCIDSIYINNEVAFLSNFWVGDADTVCLTHSCQASLSGVVRWPICSAEIVDVSVDVDPSEVSEETMIATAQCKNYNRLLSTECAVDQSISYTKEEAWSFETGTETLKQTEWEGGMEITVGVEVEFPLSITGSVEVSGHWSTTNTEATNTIAMTTNEEAESNSHDVVCSGSVEMPPSQSIEYNLFLHKVEVTVTTTTTWKLTKCSFYVDSDAEDSETEDHFIYVSGVSGVYTSSDAVSCSVEFEQSEYIERGSDDNDCGKEAALAAAGRGTYVPQCNGALYMGCQCAYGDTETWPTCGCVNTATGNLLQEGEASVVEDGDWTSWCTNECGSGSSNAQSEPGHEDRVKNNANIELANRKIVILLGSDTMISIACIAIVLYVLVYCVNSLRTCRKEENKPLYDRCFAESDLEEQI